MKTDVNVLTWVNVTEPKGLRYWTYLTTTKAHTEGYKGIPVPIDQIPPFQLKLPRTGALPNYFVIVNTGTQVRTDVLTELNSVGLSVIQPANRSYDLLSYPSKLRLGVVTAEASFYAIMIVNGIEYRSTCFEMLTFTDRHHKFTWCHNSDFELSDGHGHVQYTVSGFGSGYENYLFAKVKIGRPQWPRTVTGPEKDGEQLQQKAIRRKLWEFEFHAAEHIIDAWSAMTIHDVKKLETPEGLVFDIDEINFSVEWIHRGWGKVVGEFFTNSLNIVVNGRGASAGTCEVAPGTCVPPVGSFYQAKSILINGGSHWVAGTYLDKEGGLQSLSAGDYILSGNDGARRIYQYVSPNVYTLITVPAATTTRVYLENADEYWYDLGENLHVRISKIRSYTDLTTPWTFYGDLHPDLIGELWVENADGTTYYVMTIPDPTTFDLGIQIDVQDGAKNAVILKTGTVKCFPISEYRIETPADYIIFTNADDDDTVVITGADDDDTYYIGGQNIENIPAL